MATKSLFSGREFPATLRTATPRAVGLQAVVWVALYSAQHHSCYRMLALLGQPLVLVPFHQLWPTSVETDKKLRVDKLNGKEFYQIAKGVLRKPADLCNQSFLEECALRIRKRF